MIRQLPAGFALVIRGGAAPVIARLPRAWRNRSYRRARRLHLEPPLELPHSARWAEPSHARPHPRRDGPRQQPRLLLPLELTMNPDPIAAALDQLAVHDEQIAWLDHPRSRPPHRDHRTARRAHRAGRQDRRR